MNSRLAKSCKGNERNCGVIEIWNIIQEQERIYNKRCFICNEKAENKHHIIPKYANGSNDSGNLINICKRCHYNIHRYVVCDKCGCFARSNYWINKEEIKEGHCIACYLDYHKVKNRKKRNFLNEIYNEEQIKRLKILISKKIPKEVYS